MKEEPVLNYTLTCVDLTTYLLSYDFTAESSLFDFLFKNSVQKINKKINSDLDINKDNIEEFLLEERYYNFLNTRMKKITNEILNKEIVKAAKSGYKLNFLSPRIIKGKYKFEGDKIKIRIILKGLYREFN
jgi:hypothetical protein